MKRHFIKYFIFIFCTSLSALAQSDGKSSALNIYIENDSKNMGGPGSDNAYSSGLKISYITSEYTNHAWMKKYFEDIYLLPNIKKVGITNYGLSLGSQIYTPNDTSYTGVIDGDRPYAGWLYLGFSVLFQEELRVHTYELNVGVVGPSSYGEEIQNSFHKAIDVPEAKGWDNQLSDELAVQISYQQRQRLFGERINKDRNVDLIGLFGGSLGNVYINTHAGLMARFGYIRRDDFGPARPSMTNGDNFISPISKDNLSSNFYLFAAGQAILVGRNIFLDGNTFSKSQYVTKIPLVIETELGAAANIKNWNLSWRFVTRGPEFKERSNVNSFASISVGYSY